MLLLEGEKSVFPGVGGRRIHQNIKPLSPGVFQEVVRTAERHLCPLWLIPSPASKSSGFSHLGGVLAMY
jgi:hypothetical protein